MYNKEYVEIYWPTYEVVPAELLLWLLDKNV